ncbi:MAG: hypothetical protein Kow0075_10530 [Salibacteraceae bacterium]
MKVKAVGTGISYQWQGYNDSGYFDLNVAGANTDSLRLCFDDFSSVDSVLIRCVVTDANGDSAVSLSATLQLDSCLPPVAKASYNIVSGTNVCFVNQSKRAKQSLWNFGNGATSSKFEPCHDYDSEWVFYAKLYVFNDYGSDTAEIEVNLVGIDEIDEPVVRIFPNPATKYVNIHSDNPFAKLRLIGVTGDVLYELDGLTRSTSVEVSHLPTGVYTLAVESQDRWIYQKLLVVR